MNIITKLFETTIPSIENMKNESAARSEEHTSELQSRSDLVCRLLLEKKKHVRHAPTRERRAPADQARVAADSAMTRPHGRCCWRSARRALRSRTRRRLRFTRGSPRA